jgi:hypothetical protein
MRLKALLLALALGAVPAAASAQVVIRPEREPARVAGQEAWYRAGEPVMHRGELFYPAGALVFFNPTVMVLAGEYRGVPVYVDPTVETGSLVYLPIGNGQMQPYERLRAGDLAGTSGSRTPSFPPETASALREPSVAVGTAGVTPPPPPVGDLSLAAAAARGAAPSTAVTTIAPAGASRGQGIWINWDDRSWRAAGGAVRVGPQFVAIGTFNGRTVYRGPEGDATIWIETAQGLASPWRR